MSACDSIVTRPRLLLLPIRTGALSTTTGRCPILLGDPSTFKWAAATAAVSAGDDVKNGYNNILLFDQAPNINQGAPQAIWPQ